MVSIHQRRLIESAGVIGEMSAVESGDVGYMTRVLTQTTLPHSNPHAREFKRSNGWLTVTIVDVGGVGLPYGTMPRLLLSWITTEAVKSKSKEIILGDSMNGFMRQLGMESTGGVNGSIARLTTQLTRLSSCAISYKVEDETMLHMTQTTIAKEIHLWHSQMHLDQVNSGCSYVTLSQDFYDEIIERPVPIDMRALAALRRSSMALDIYMWLTFRMSYLRRSTAITWEQLQMQFGAGFEHNVQGQKNFRRAFTQHLKSVLVVYPGARVELARGRLKLQPSPTHVKRKA